MLTLHIFMKYFKWKDFWRKNIIKVFNLAWEFSEVNYHLEQVSQKSYSILSFHHIHIHNAGITLNIFHEGSFQLFPPWVFTPSLILFIPSWVFIIFINDFLPHPIFITSWDFTPSHIYSFISFNPIPYLFLHEFLAHPIFNPSWIFNPIPYLFLHKCSLFTSNLFLFI